MAVVSSRGRSRRPTTFDLTFLADAGPLHDSRTQIGASTVEWTALTRYVKRRTEEETGLAIKELQGHLWTSSPRGPDERFDKFVDFIERTLEFKVHPTDGPRSYLADLRPIMDANVPERIRRRLQRHDVALAYAIGRLVDQVIAACTDSFPVADALLAASERRAEKDANALPNFLIAPRSKLAPQLASFVEATPLLRLVDLDPVLNEIFPTSNGPVRREATGMLRI